MNICEICGNSFERGPKSGHKVTCSPKCSSLRSAKKCNEKRKGNKEYLEKRSKNKKIKEYMYNYARRPEVLKKRAEQSRNNRKEGKFTGWSLTAWSNSVKANYNYTCSSCGATENLQAHHLFSRKDFPELADLETNGICLCKNCHYTLHLHIGREA